VQIVSMMKSKRATAFPQAEPHCDRSVDQALKLDADVVAGAELPPRAADFRETKGHVLSAEAIGLRHLSDYMLAIDGSLMLLMEVGCESPASACWRDPDRHLEQIPLNRRGQVAHVAATARPSAVMIWS
jgi:hypothetical protein